MAPFYGWGSTASRLEPLRGGSLLFTTKVARGNKKGYSKAFCVTCKHMQTCKHKARLLTIFTLNIWLSSGYCCKIFLISLIKFGRMILLIFLNPKIKNLSFLHTFCKVRTWKNAMFYLKQTELLIGYN